MRLRRTLPKNNLHIKLQKAPKRRMMKTNYTRNALFIMITLLQRTIKALLGSLAIVSFALFSGFSIVSAQWSNPTGAPPTNNVAPPINDSATSQVKAGGLSLGSLVVNGGTILDGFLSIGGGTPAYDIDIEAQDNIAVVRLANTATGYTAQDGSWLQLGQNTLYLRNREAAGIQFWTSDTARAVLNSAGNLIIGGTNPTAGLMLDVEGNVGAQLYCDETAANCFDPADVVTSSTTPPANVGFWLENAGNVYRETGSVGIGSAAIPKAQLDLSATTVRSDTPGTNQKLQFSSGNTGLFGFRLSNDNTTLHLDRYWGSWGTPAISIVRGNGRVGIGETAPNSDLRLDVGGKVGATEYCDGDGANCIAAGSLGSQLWTVNGADVYRPAGEVGIGISNPSASLDTVGDIRIGGGDLFAGAGQRINWGSAAYTRFDSNNATVSGLRLFNNAGDEYGRVYGSTGDNIGFLDGDAQWAFQHTKDVANYFKINNVTKLDQRVNYANFNQGLYIYTDVTDADFNVRDSDKGTVSNVIWYDYSAGRVYLGNTGGSGTNPEVTVRGDLTVDQAIQANGGLTIDGKQVLDAFGGRTHTAEWNDNTRYGYFQGRKGDGTRGFYLGYGSPGNYINMALEDGNDLFYVSGGGIGIGDSTLDGGSLLDVNGKIAAIEYCDEAGANCLDATNINNAGLWTDHSSYIRHAGNVAVEGWIGAGCEGGCDTDGNYQITYPTGTTVARHTGPSAVIDAGTTGTSYGVYGHASQNYGIVGRTFSAPHGGVLGYNHNAAVYGILGHGNGWTLYGNGPVYASGYIRSGGSIVTGSRHIYFNTSETGQNLYGDGSDELYFDSNHARYSGIVLRRSDNTELGTVWGDKNGTGSPNFGLLDGNGHWAFRTSPGATTPLTRIYANNEELLRVEKGTGSNSATIWGNGKNSRLQISTSAGDNLDAYTYYRTNQTGGVLTYWASGVDGSQTGHPFKIRPAASSDGGSPAFTIERDGSVGINDTTPDASLTLDVEGAVGASQYCDQNGANCVAAGGLGGLWTLSGTTAIYNGGNVAIGNQTTGRDLNLWGTTAGAYSRLRTTNGNLHIDSSLGTGGNNDHIYLNYYSGKDVLFGNGATGVSARVYGATGDATFNGSVNAGYVSIDPQDGTNEGGEVRLLGSGSYGNIQLDNYQGNLRVHTLASGKLFDILGGNGIRIQGGRNIFFGVSQQRIYGDAGSAIYFDSNSSGISQLIFRDLEDDTYGRVYASQGDNIGFLDGDGQWAIQHVKDSRTEFRTNNGLRLTVGPTQTITDRYGIAGTYSSSQVQGIWSIGDAYDIDPAADTFGNQYGLVYSYQGNGGSVSGQLHQISFVDNGNRTGGISVSTGDIMVRNLCSANGTNCITPATIASGVSDNLGNHTATQALTMGTHGINSAAGTIRDGNGGWVRMYGNTGWYNGTHGGGMYMIDSTWVRTYQNKNLYSGTGLIRADGGFQVDAKSVISNNGSVHSAQYPSNTRYGYFEGRNNAGTRGYYLGYGNGSSRVDLVLDAASDLYISGGQVGIGVSAPNDALDVSGDGQFTGTVTANAFVYSSDERLKKNLGSFKDKARDILKLNTYTYEWNEKDGQDFGVIAQEVEELFPELVLEDSVGYKAVDYAQLVVPLLEVTKQQQAEIDELRKMIEDLQ